MPCRKSTAIRIGHLPCPSPFSGSLPYSRVPPPPGSSVDIGLARNIFDIQTLPQSILHTIRSPSPQQPTVPSLHDSTGCGCAMRQTPSWHLSCPDSLWSITTLARKSTSVLWEKKKLRNRLSVVKITQDSFTAEPLSVVSNKTTQPLLSTLLGVSSFAPGDNCEELYHVCCWGLPCHQALLPSGCSVLADEATGSFSILLLVSN